PCAPIRRLRWKRSLPNSVSAKRWCRFSMKKAPRPWSSVLLYCRRAAASGRSPWTSAPLRSSVQLWPVFTSRLWIANRLTKCSKSAANRQQPHRHLHRGLRQGRGQYLAMCSVASSVKVTRTGNPRAKRWSKALRVRLDQKLGARSCAACWVPFWAVPAAGAKGAPCGQIAHLDVETKMHDVTVLDYVLLAFQSHLSRFLGALLAPVVHIVVE